MDSALVTSISSIGFSVVACIFLWRAIIRKDEENKKYTSLLVNSLEKDIKELKNENKKDKQMFQSALKTFDNTVKSFSNIKKDIIDIKDDLNDIKGKIK